MLLLLIFPYKSINPVSVITASKSQVKNIFVPKILCQVKDNNYTKTYLTALGNTMGQKCLKLWVAFASFIFLLAKIQVAVGLHFCYTYEECDPDHWEAICKDGKNQSPIDLDKKNATKKPNHPLSFGKNFRGTQSNFFITNNGHSVQVQANENATSKSEFVHRDKKLHYKFAQLHFHWGTTNSNGSEHTLNGQRFPLELHLVHIKTKFANLAAALNSGDPEAFSVMGVFYKIGNHSEALEHVVKEIQAKTLKDTERLVKTRETLSLADFIPRKQSFFRYHGSLTTPTCNELVLWVVFDTPLELSKEQAEIFHKVQSETEHGHRFQNFRPVQPLHGRKIEYFVI